MYFARIYVTLKPTVNDPEGRTVMGSLQSLGFQSVNDVRVGKYIELRFEDSDKSSAETHVEEMCDKLLANLVIEKYRYEVEEA
jgi:phosphoribosylformylglycinamidine synthase